MEQKSNEWYPLRFAPVYKDYIWGGRRFIDRFQRELDPEGIYAESWEIADHEAGHTSVLAGALAGEKLSQVLAASPEELMGSGYSGGDRFPLLLKHLDACNSLSVQVHPDDDTAVAMCLADVGKTEAWYVVDKQPGAGLWLGLKDVATPEELRAAIDADQLEKHLNWLEPEIGDCLFIPAGMVHALGQGLLITEIQQNSNTTFRLYDWNRRTPEGELRPLHIDEALRAIRFEHRPEDYHIQNSESRGNCSVLVDCPYFKLSRVRHSGKEENSPEDIVLKTEGRCRIITIIEGALQLEGDPLGGPLSAGDTVLLPAALTEVRASISGAEPLTYLDIAPGDIHYTK